LLISPAKLWVLDEPFTTLDTKGVAQLESILQDQAQAGGAVMVTTHHQLTIPELSLLSLG
jgi:heme exporter protein A